MSEPKKIVSIEELRRRAAEQGDTLESLSEADIELLAEELRKELGDLPDVRMDRIALAKARISKGYYTGERIAEGLIDSIRGPAPPDPLPLHGPDSVGSDDDADPAARPDSAEAPEDRDSGRR